MARIGQTPRAGPDCSVCSGSRLPAACRPSDCGRCFPDALRGPANPRELRPGLRSIASSSRPEGRSMGRNRLVPPRVVGFLTDRSWASRPRQTIASRFGLQVSIAARLPISARVRTRACRTRPIRWRTHPGFRLFPMFPPNALARSWESATPPRLSTALQAWRTMIFMTPHTRRPPRNPVAVPENFLQARMRVAVTGHF